MNESIHLISTNGYHEKLEKEAFCAADSRCRRNLKFEISRLHLAHYVKEMYLNARSTCVNEQRDYFSSINQ